MSIKIIYLKIIYLYRGTFSCDFLLRIPELHCDIINYLCDNIIITFAITNNIKNVQENAISPTKRCSKVRFYLK